MKHPTIPMWQLPYIDEQVAFPMEVIIRKCFHNGKLEHVQIPRYPLQVRQIVLGDEHYKRYRGNIYSYIKSKLSLSPADTIPCWRSSEEDHCDGEASLQSLWISVPLVLIFEFEGENTLNWACQRFMAIRGINDEHKWASFNYELVSRAYFEKLEDVAPHFTCNIISSTGSVHDYDDTKNKGVMTKTTIKPDSLAKKTETYSYKKTVAAVYRLQGGRQSQIRIGRGLRALLQTENIRISPGDQPIPKVFIDNTDPVLIPNTVLSNYTRKEYDVSPGDSDDGSDKATHESHTTDVESVRGDDYLENLSNNVSIDDASAPNEGDGGAEGQQSWTTNGDDRDVPLVKKTNFKKRPNPSMPRGPVTRSKTRRLGAEQSAVDKYRPRSIRQSYDDFQLIVPTLDVATRKDLCLPYTFGGTKEDSDDAVNVINCPCIGTLRMKTSELRYGIIQCRDCKNWTHLMCVRYGGFVVADQGSVDAFKCNSCRCEVPEFMPLPIWERLVEK